MAKKPRMPLTLSDHRFVGQMLKRSRHDLERAFYMVDGRKPRSISKDLWAAVAAVDRARCLLDEAVVRIWESRPRTDADDQEARITQIYYGPAE